MEIQPTRTTCACEECVRCCKEQPGSLLPGDFERISQHLSLSVKDASEFFRSSPGALVMDTNTGRQFRIRTIVPAYDKRKKRCVFLNDEDRCTIHAVAPGGCSMFDTHMDTVEGQQRSAWAVRQQQDPVYQELRQTLKVAEHYKPRGF